jgi:phage gp36-like protein
MPYATRDDLLSRYGQEIEGLETAESKPPGSTDAALEDAAAEINGYVAKRYKLPLPAGKVFSVLKWLSCDIARFRLWESRIEDGTDTTAYVRYRKAIAFLAEIASGKMTLVDTDGDEPPLVANESGFAVISRRKPVFTNSTLRKMDYGSDS